MDLTDQELVARCQAGKNEAFKALVERYQQRAYRIAYGILHQSDDAMDAAQEAFIKVYQNIDNFRGESSFYTWLGRIVTNICIDTIRKRKRSQAVAFDEKISPPSDVGDQNLIGNMRETQPGASIERKDLNKALNEALSLLSEAHRTTILLRDVDGLSYEEIAEVMQCHVGTVMSRLHYARKNLQISLRPYLKATGAESMAEHAGEGVRRSS